MLLVSIISVVAIILVYQALFYWVFKDPVSIKGFVKSARENNAAKEIGFKINNRISKAFAIEKII